jgi:hypothetical protein
MSEENEAKSEAPMSIERIVSAEVPPKEPQPRAPHERGSQLKRINSLCRWGATCKFQTLGRCRFAHPHPGGRFSVVHMRNGAIHEVTSFLDKFTAIEKFHTILPPLVPAEAAASVLTFVVPAYYHFQLGNESWALVGLNVHDMATFVRLPPALPPIA